MPACSKSFSLDVASAETPDCPLLDGAVWTPFGPQIGASGGSGSGASFNVFSSTPPLAPAETRGAIHTSFVYSGPSRLFTVEIDATIVNSATWVFRVTKNAVQIYRRDDNDPGGPPFVFQLLSTDAGTTIDISAVVSCGDLDPTPNSVTMSGRITCEEGIGNAVQSSHVACGSECTGPGGDATVLAGTVIRPTLLEANTAAQAQALAEATADAALPENCCCLNWEFTQEAIPAGATASGDGNILVATYNVTTNNINQIVRFSGKVLVPACAIPPGTTNIIVQINFNNCGNSSTTYIWNYYDPNFFSGTPLASQIGSSGIFSHSRLISGGAGVMFRVNLGDTVATFNGTGTVTITFS